MLRERWGLATGPSETVASEGLHFWDEAGFFVISDDGHELASPVAQFAELGAARRLIRRGSPVEEVLKLATHETSIEVLNLACGLDEKAAETMIHTAREASRIDWILAVADGLVEGPLDDEDLDGLFDFLLATDVGDTRTLDVAHLLVRFVVPELQRGAVRAWLDSHVSPKSSTTLTALARRRWGETDGRQAVRLLLWEGPPSDQRGTVARNDTEFRIYLEAVEQAVRDLDPNDADAVAKAGERAGLSTVRFARHLESLAAGNGITLRPERLSKSLGFALQWIAANQPGNDPLDVAFPEFLRLIANLATPVEVSRGERRRLDELARLFGVLKFNDSPYNAISEAMRTRRDDMRDLLLLISTVSDVDPHRLASEAASAADECCSPEDQQVLMSAVAHDPAIVSIDRWDRFSQEDAERALRLLRSTDWIKEITQDLLTTAPADLRATITAS